MKEDTQKIVFTDTPVKQNPYYHKVSSGYRLLKYIAIITLVAYMIVTLAVNRKNLTRENFMYLLKDLSPGESTSSGFASIAFDETVESCTLFKGSLITVANNSLSLYKSNGKQAFSYSLDYEAPILVAGEKYLLAYAIGENLYSLYTNLSKVYSGTTEHELLGAAVAPDGSYALITKSSESKFAVSLYDSSFKLRANYYKNKYVIDCAISSDSSRLIIVSLDLDSSRPETEIMICKLGESSAETVITEKDIFPLDVCEMKDGGFAVVGSSALLFYSQSGELISRFDYKDGELSKVCASESGVLLVLRNDSLGETATAVLFSEKGEQLLRHSINEAVTAAALSDDLTRIFYASRDKIYMLTRNGELTEQPSENAVSLMPYKNSVIAASAFNIFMCFADGSAES